jgi:hypothetical protein
MNARFGSLRRVQSVLVRIVLAWHAPTLALAVHAFSTLQLLWKQESLSQCGATPQSNFSPSICGRSVRPYSRLIIINNKISINILC